MKRKNNLLNLTKESIHHLYPNVSSLDITMIKLSNNHFGSKIEVKTKLKYYFAKKEAENYKLSLEKSCKAITKQLEKEKVRKIHSAKPEMIAITDDLEEEHDITEQ